MLRFRSMTASPLDIKVQDIDHCGIVAGICDEMNLVEQINRLLGTHSQEIISAGQVVKAMILNGLGFVSAPLYLFEKFFVGKATEHLLGEGIRHTEDNLQQMKHLRWVSRVPGTLTAAKMLLEEMPEVAFHESAMPGYRITLSCSEYGGVRQSWLVVESQARKEADLKQLEKRLIKKTYWTW